MNTSNIPVFKWKHEIIIYKNYKSSYADSITNTFSELPLKQHLHLAEFANIKRSSQDFPVSSVPSTLTCKLEMPGKTFSIILWKISGADVTP